MVRLYAKSLHIYEDRPNHRHWWIPAGEWREVPREIALYLVGAHPDKLVILEEGQDYPTTQVVVPPADTQIVPPVDRQMRARKGKS